MRHIVSSFTATALIQGANIVSGILLARFLQPDGRGDLAAVMLWPSVIAAVGILGLHEAVAYHAARRRHGADDILRSSLALGALISVILVPIGAVVVDLVMADRPAEVREAAFLYLAFIPVNYAALFFVGLFQGRMRFDEWNILRTLVHVVYLLLIPAVYLLGWGGVFGFAAASLAANAMTILASALLYRRAIAGEDASNKTEEQVPAWRALAAYGAGVHLGAAIAIVAERLDQMIVAVALSAVDLGLFVVATTVARLPVVPASTLATVAFPKIAAVEGDDKLHVFARYSRATCLVVIAVSLALAVVMPWLLPLLFGQAFADAVPVAWLLILAAVPLSLKAMLSSGLKAIDRARIVSETEIAALALSAAGLAVLVPLYGLLGAAVASAAAQGGAFLFMSMRIRRVLGMSPMLFVMPGRDEFVLIGEEVARLLRRRIGGESR